MKKIQQEQEEKEDSDEEVRKYIISSPNYSGKAIEPKTKKKPAPKKRGEDNTTFKVKTEKLELQ